MKSVSKFTAIPQWLNHTVTLPLATIAPDACGVGFNHEQVAAIRNLFGRNLISSSAGTGKTSVLVARLKSIVEQYPGATVLMVSFTKKAVLELQERIGYAEGLTVCTFHSLAYRILKSADKEFTLDSNATGLLSQFVAGTGTTADEVRHALHGVSGATKATLAVKERYLDYLRENHLVTFDTMQLFALNLLREDNYLRQKWQKKFDFVLIDEYMDSDSVQVDLIELLAEVSGNLTVVADKKQSIYSFRDAVPSVIDDFAEDANVFDLNINYRSNPAILGLANKVMNTNKPLVAAINDEPIYPQFCTASDSLDEAKTVVDEIVRLHKKGMNYADMAVLFRSSSSAGMVYQELLNRKIPVVSKSNLQTKYGRKPYSDVVKLFRYMVNPDSVKACKEILPILYLKQERFKDVSAIVKEKGCSFTEAVRSLDLVPFTKRYIDDMTTAIDTAKNHAPAVALKMLANHGFKKYLGFRYSYALEELLTELKEFSSITAFLVHVDAEHEQIIAARKLAAETSDHIQLMSIHASKGMEFKIVFLIGANDGCLPSTRSDNIEEEKRLLYVAITRAKEQLFISYPRVSDNHSGYNEVSRFLREAFAV